MTVSIYYIGTTEKSKTKYQRDKRKYQRTYVRTDRQKKHRGVRTQRDTRGETNERRDKRGDRMTYTQSDINRAVEVCKRTTLI